MQILLACAKIMNEATETKTPLVTKPKFLKEAEHFALLMSQRTVDELMDMFHCSRQLAIENKLRYERFFAENESLPAILAYYGQAYKCLSANHLSSDDFLYAQHHLWIASFLYGLLRPLDMIHPYRMEGKVELDGKTIIPFGTHGGSGVGSYATLIKEYYPNASVLESLGISGSNIRNVSSKTTVENWLKKLGVDKQSTAINNVRTRSVDNSVSYSLNGMRSNGQRGIQIRNGNKYIKQ